jgi:hypothetical protein
MLGGGVVWALLFFMVVKWFFMLFCVCFIVFLWCFYGENGC